MRRLTRIAAAVAGMIVASSCGESAVAPDSDALIATAAKLGADRILAITLTAPNAGDGGLMFSVDGPNILDVVPAEGYDILKTPADGRGRSEVKVLLVGEVQSGIVAYAMVKGASANPFTATVSQVAAGGAGNYAQRADLSAYRLSLSVQR